MKEDLIVIAFKKVLLSRSAKPAMIVHSDRDNWYTGNKFKKLVTDNKLQQSMSRVGNPYDNTFIESCFSRFKTKLLQGDAFQNRNNARTEIFKLIEIYYNTEGGILLSVTKVSSAT